jgi:hypothetical protein
MANGNGNGNGNGTPFKNVIIVLVSTGILGVLSSGMLAIANDARIAIRVAEQHGEELLLIRGELTSLRVEMLERTKARYTAIDAERHERYVLQRIEALEKQLERCCSQQ